MPDRRGYRAVSPCLKDLAPRDVLRVDPTQQHADRVARLGGADGLAGLLQRCDDAGRRLPARTRDPDGVTDLDGALSYFSLTKVPRPVITPTSSIGISNDPTGGFFGGPWLMLIPPPASLANYRQECRGATTLSAESVSPQSVHPFDNSRELSGASLSERHHELRKLSGARMCEPSTARQSSTRPPVADTYTIPPSGHPHRSAHDPDGDNRFGSGSSGATPCRSPSDARSP